VQAGQHRPAVAHPEREALGVERDVEDAVRRRPQGEADRQPARRRGQRADEQAGREDGEPEPGAAVAAPAADERRTQR
jgi:hypothetical protein